VTEQDPNAKPRGAKHPKEDDRKARQAEALRANLRRRKAQASARKGPAGPASDREPPSDQ
jgi:hypothetical protein